MTSPSSIPTSKIQAVGYTGALAVVLVWVSDTLFHVNMPEPVAAGLAVLAAAVAGYVKTERRTPHALPRRAAHDRE